MRRTAIVLPVLLPALMLSGCTKKDRDKAAKDACNKFAAVRSNLEAGKGAGADDLAEISAKAAQSTRKGLIEATARLAKVGATNNKQDAIDAAKAVDEACKSLVS
jgi:PBP1b-binding outer membrane lipoprotein LpoB